MNGFRGLTFQNSLAAFSAERVYSKAELDAAVAAERERCAKVCEMYAAYMRAKKGMPDSQLTDRLLEQHGHVGNDLAATIRIGGAVLSTA